MHVLLRKKAGEPPNRSAEHQSQGHPYLVLRVFAAPHDRVLVDRKGVEGRVDRHVGVAAGDNLSGAYK